MGEEHTPSGLVVPEGMAGGFMGSAGGLPDGVKSHGYPRGAPHGEWTQLDGNGVIVNETDLPDQMVMEAATDHFVASAGLASRGPTNFQLYNQRQGSMLARSEFRTPTNVIDEIALARDLAERDDDVAAVMREVLALAFGEGMEHTHSDEKSLAIFNEVAKAANLDHGFKEMYREYLIASQFTTGMLFTREEVEFTPRGAQRASTTMASTPVLGVFQSEHIRIIGNDMFGTGILAYDPPDSKLREWLDEYFNPKTTPARKAEMGRQDRATANLFTGVIENDSSITAEDRPWSWSGYGRMYLLNPRLCFRTTMAKGQGKYPKPLLTANFALLEAKRLLNIMDYALLQGGSNFIVVAKKGSDQRPAQPAEIENLMGVVRNASRSGVIVGDHRLSFEIITPKLDELLNEKKRRLLGRKIAMRMMGIGERADDTGSEGEQSDTEVLSRVVMSDRRDIARHVENKIYPEVVKRNRTLLTKGPAGVWFPKIVLQGLNYFTDLVLKLRDRGDIARSTAVAAAGFDWESEIAKRKQEKASGADEIMTPTAVPHSSPDKGPQDNNEGRPKGAGDGNEQDPAKPKRTISRNPGETVKAWYDEDLEEIVRVGEITYAILEEYAATKVEDGLRVTGQERQAIDNGEPVVKGGIAVVPVNIGLRVHDELRVVKLRDGLRMVVGHTLDEDAIVAVALSFREPEFSIGDVELRAARWGYGVPALESPKLPELPEGISDDQRQALEVLGVIGGGDPAE